MADVVWKVTLSNPCRPDLPAIELDAAIVDEPYYCALPAFLCDRLGLTQVDVRTLMIDQVKSIDVPYVGPIKLHFGNSMGYGGVLKAGHRVRIGSIAVDALLADT